jgi:hypothetical protein
LRNHTIQQPNLPVEISKCIDAASGSSKAVHRHLVSVQPSLPQARHLSAFSAYTVTRSHLSSRSLRRFANFSCVVLRVCRSAGAYLGIRKRHIIRAQRKKLKSSAPGCNISKLLKKEGGSWNGKACATNRSCKYRHVAGYR